MNDVLKIDTKPVRAKSAVCCLLSVRYTAEAIGGK